jgi:hypothetical protein
MGVPEAACIFAVSHYKNVQNKTTRRLYMENNTI